MSLQCASDGIPDSGRALGPQPRRGGWSDSARQPFLASCQSAKLALFLSAVNIDDDTQAQFASVGHAKGVSFPQSFTLIDLLIPGKGLSIATLARRVRAAGKRSGPLLKVFDEFTYPRVRDAIPDEIYVRAPVLMIVEQESLCWVCGSLQESATGEAWYEQFKQLSNLEQVARDGGSALKKGVALLNEQRAEQGRPAVVDQGDHFHAFREAGSGLRKAAQQASKALAAAEKAQAVWEECQKRADKAWQSPCQRARIAWQKAEQAMDRWSALEQTCAKAKAALQLLTPEGELNTRARAEQVLAETLPALPDQDFAKLKRALQQPEMLNYLDRVHEKLEGLPLAPAVKQAAIRLECLRRSPEVRQGEGISPAAMRGLMLVCMVVLNKSGKGVGDYAVAAVGEIFRRAYRASSLVESINSVLRMQQTRHRKMTPEMLDLKRLYWNSHAFRTGKRRQTTPYGRLGVPWPEGMTWWQVLKLTPEQLREKLSTAQQAA